MHERRRGFTLIELMLVLVVIGLVYGIVFLKLDHVLSRYRLRGAARDVLATMQLARSQAVSQQRAFRIVFDLTDGAFWIERAPDAAQGPLALVDRPAARKLDRGVRIERVQTSGEDWTTGSVWIEYAPSGCASACEVHLAGDDGRKMSIEVNPLNGYARLQG